METYEGIDDLLIDTWVETYCQLRDAIWRQIVTLNTNLFILGKIEAFPLELFIPLEDDRIFWNTTKRALIESSLMIIWRIAIDNDGDSLTIPQFKNEIFKNCKDKKAKDYLRNLINERSDFDRTVSRVEETIKEIRHNYLAHFNRALQMNPTTRSINLKILKDTCASIQSLFDVLCLDHGHSLWLWGYSENARATQDTDIDKLLLNIANNSQILNLPEQQPHIADLHFKGYSKQELELINHYRRRFEMAPLAIPDSDND